jgi:hypothetical protein
MTKRHGNSGPDSDSDADDGILAEDITQLIEHIELTGAQERLVSGPDWELAAPAEELDDAPVLVDDDSSAVPDLERIEAAEDIELFTETEVDLNQRLLQVEDEQLELAAALAAERARWQKRVESLQMDLTERNQLLADREAEIEDLSAQLASMTLERDGNLAELRDLRLSAGLAEAAAAQRPTAPTDAALESLRERLHERGRALLVAREEIDRLRADREKLVAGLSERGAFIQRLHERLRGLEGGYKGSGELRKLLRRFFGGEQRVEAPLAEAAAPPATAPAAPETLEDPTPRRVVLADLQQMAPPEEAPMEPGAAPQLRRYLIGLDLVGRVHEVRQPRISVGRTQDNDLRIVDSTVSRLHAVLKLRGGEVTVIDANSRNGVFVNGIQVRHAKLADGDMLAFGTVRFRYRVGSGSSGGGFGPA